jgi:hypothetical protein
MKIVWNQLDSMDGERTLSQHAFKNKEFNKKWLGETFIAAESLCGKFSVSDNGENMLSTEELHPEELREHDACKTCLRIFKKSN